jgi:mono/diheme cytochrome c family protein
MRNRIVLLLVGGLFLVAVAACGASATPAPTQAPTTAPTIAPTEAPTRTATVAPTDTASAPSAAMPSNPGGPGKAIDLTGDPTAGKKVYQASCLSCHGTDAKGGVPNPGSDDGTVPPLNPIDETIKSPDYKTFATNIDLWVEHGSTPAGTKPTFLMTNFGDNGTLTPQQIADVIAYVISLNK